jgi:hypothetical protein
MLIELGPGAASGRAKSSAGKRGGPSWMAGSSGAPPLNRPTVGAPGEEGGDQPDSDADDDAAETDGLG